MNSKSTTTILIIIASVGIIGTAFSTAGYFSLKSDNAFKIDKLNRKYEKKQVDNQITIKELTQKNNDLKKGNKAVEDSTLDSKDYLLNNYKDVTDKFVNAVIGVSSAKEIRSKLKNVASEAVILKMAPVDENEKYDSQITKSEKEMDTISSYADLNSMTNDSIKVYAVAQYSIDKSSLKTRFKLTLTRTDNKLQVTEAEYDLNPNASAQK